MAEIRCPRCERTLQVSVRKRRVECPCGHVIDRARHDTNPGKTTGAAARSSRTDTAPQPPPPLRPTVGTSLLGRVLGDQFRLTAVLGQGGMGVVYRGEHVAVMDLVSAVKVVRPEYAADPGFRKRLQDEANVMQKIRHENVVRMLGFGLPEAGQPYLFLEYVAGPGGGAPLTLEGELASAHFDIDEGVRILVGAARGMEAAHAAGVIHRDLKPGNILIDARREAKVTDFGIARWERLASNQTQGAICTPAYASPEQVYARDVDHRADVFCLGRVLFEVMAGFIPEPEDVVRAPSTYRRRGDAALDAIVARATKAAKGDRYQSMTELREALEAWLRGRASDVTAEPAHEAPADPPPPVRVPSVPAESRRRLVVTAPPELAGRTFPLGRVRMIIGSGDECDLRLSHATVGPIHAAVVFQDGGYAIEDLTGGRGVKVNRVSVQSAELGMGDVVAIGAVVLRLVDAWTVVPTGT